MEHKLQKLPNHIAFIIDGNGRWAKKRGLTRSMGHKHGFDRLQQIAKKVLYDYNIPYMSVYCFSTENWNRPKKEVDYLIKIFRNYVNTNWEKKYPNTRVNFCGDMSKFPADIYEKSKEVMERTKKHTEHTINFCMNYSGRYEILHAVQEIVNKGIKNVELETIEDHLYTKGQPAIDFCIRTSGELRVSNFMLWQLAYAEFEFNSVYWPDYDENCLFNSLLEYQRRDRRFGEIKE